jgi:hypothetical protein
MASPEAVYQSVPLDLQKRESRLLILHPAFAQNDELVCSLFHASFDDELKVPKYEALSYEWGTPLPSYNLIINGAPFSIRENLHAALISLRKQKEERVLWIDAICINQTDDAEKSQQVQIMHLIYSKADRVIGWLGEEQADDNGAKSAFEKLSRYITLRDGNYNAKEIMQHYQDPGGTSMPKYPSEWTAICSILGKRWFSRVWIIQEIVMAPHLSLRCGGIELDRSVIENTLHFLSSSLLITLTSLHKAKQALSMIATARMAISALAESEPWTLMKVLWVTRSFGASFPRDRLFAFLRVIKARHDSFLVPDYKSSNAELYTRWAAHSLVEEPPFMCLSLACPSQSLLGESLPTWVPDWGAATSYKCISQNVSFKTLTGFPPYIRLSDCQNHLTLSGVRLDTIRAVGSKQAWKDEWAPMGTATPGHLEIPLLSKEFIDEAEDIVTEAFSPHEYSFEMFWRTLIFNTTHGGQSTSSQAPPEYAQSFKAYREVVDLLIRRAAGDKRSLYLKALDFDQAFASYVGGRKFGITQGLRMGMFPNTTELGDVIFAPMGANVPFVLREAGNRRHTLVGECYLYGVMYGELVEEPGWEKNVKDITIC